MSHSTVEPNLKPNRNFQSQVRTHGLLPCLLVLWLMSPLSATAAIDRAAIASTGEFSCALLTDGSVQCWGRNSVGQLGDGTTDNRSRPVVVDGLTGGVVQIAAGGNHACAVLQDQTVKCWGRGDSGQLGDGATANRSTPVSVADLTGVVEVDAGNAHTCARLGDGAVKCWGSQFGGLLGNGETSLISTSPVNVTSLDGTEASRSATVISVGDSHTCAVLEDQTVKCWGRGTSGRLGDGATEDRSTPVSVAGLTGVVEVAAGGAHSCARLSSGAVQCWGSRTRLGDNATSDRSTAGPVTGIDGASDDASAIAISSGGSGSCALMADQTVRCWGLGGRNGDGSTENALTPSKVLSSGSNQDSDPPLSDAVAVSVGASHGCALVNDGEIFCWGVGSSGQLGNGEVRVGNDPALNPVPVLSSGTADADPVPFSVLVAPPMVLKFDTSKGDGRTIALSLRGVVDVVIDWGDGNTTTRQEAGIVAHDYTEEGEYEVRIAGSVTHFGQAATGSNNALAGAEMLVEVVSFGTLGIESLQAAFLGAENLTQVASDLPSTVTNLRSVFEGATRFNGDISGWQLGNVTDLSRALWGASAFNQPIGAWDVSNVTNFSSTFRGASEFNAALDGWDVSKATNFFGMFQGASNFNSDLSEWNVSSVTNMGSMFLGAVKFTSDLSAWDVSNVTNMRQMFGLAAQFNSDLSEWDVSSVTNMQLMFSGAQAFLGQGISNWNIVSVAGPELAPNPDQNQNLSTGLGLMFEFSGLTRANYDAMLLAWSQLPNLPSDLNLFVPTKHTVGPAGEAKERLITVFGWTITDTGSVNVFAAGDGTEDDPFQIANWTHLDKVRNFPASHFILKNHLSNITPDYSDFVDSAEGWSPIGSPSAPFTGSLDGAELEIADLVINRPTEDHIGLFAAIDGATIQKLTLSRADVRGRGPVGALVGSVRSNSQVSMITMDGQVGQTGTDSPFFHRGGGCLVGVAGGTAEIQDVQADCQIVVDGSWSADYTGGLIGWLVESASVENAHTRGTVVGQFRTGGLIGRMDDNSIVTQSSSSMSVTASDNSAGGLVGRMDDNAVVHRSFATGDVGGTDRVGGLIGDMDDAPVVQQSFATGNVSGGLRVGGLVGYMDDDSVVEQSFATGNVIGDWRVGGLIGEMDNESRIENVYATGNVTGDDRVGGLVGRLDDRDNQVINAWSSGTVTANTQFGGLIGEDRQGATVENSFWDVETSGLGASGDDNFGATGRTTAEMKQESNFTGWDFSPNGVWDIKTEETGFISYPFLRNISYDPPSSTAPALPIPGLASVAPAPQPRVGNEIFSDRFEQRDVQ